MPTYEYKCDACGHEFEKFQSITAPAIRKCPECGKNKVKRLISSGAGLIFKGSGFYITDYRSDSYKNAAKSDSGAPAKTEGAGKPAGSGAGGAAKSDSAPAKTESAPAKSEPAAKPAATPKRKSEK
jgi:putative FmdB family regulatory protein